MGKPVAAVVAVAVVVVVAEARLAISLHPRAMPGLTQPKALWKQSLPKPARLSRTLHLSKSAKRLDRRVVAVASVVRLAKQRSRLKPRLRLRLRSRRAPWQQPLLSPSRSRLS
jgi:hypothetical protein